MIYKTLHAALEAVKNGETNCRGNDQALLALGLRALLAAIGKNSFYKERYIAKGGTVLRLWSADRMERLSTDLDLSGLELGNTTAEEHREFAADIGRSATEILRTAYAKGDADITVQFDENSLGRVHDESDPDTITYGVIISAALQPNKNPTIVRGAAYKIDLTCDEYVDKTLIKELIVNSYGIPIDVLAYAPVQSIAEKMRAILQKRRHFERKQDGANWVPRHLFDLVPLRKLILADDLQRLPELFRKKCECRKIDVDNQTRTWMLDTRLLEIAQKKDKPRADAAWGILQDLMEIAEIPF